MRLLLVDDEPLLTTMLSHAIRLELGDAVEITKASNGKEALDAVAAQAPPPDLIVSDLDMPVMTGTELYAALRERGTKIPFVFLTGADVDPKTLPPDVPLLGKHIELKHLVTALRAYLQPSAAPTPAPTVAPEARPVFAPRGTQPVVPSAEDLAGLIRLAAQDIREQLMVVRGYHNMIEPALTPDVRPHLASARRSLARLGVITGEVADWIKLGEGSLVPTLEPINAAMFVAQVLQSSQGALDEAGIRLDTSGIQRPPMAKADPRLLDRVLHGILEAVLLNMPRNQTLRVSTGPGPTNETIGVVFRFACPRVPATALVKLFDWQERDNLRRAGFQPGRGLGMAFARRAVQAMGGRLEARSPREGELAIGLALQATGQLAAPEPSPRPRILMILPSPIETNLLLQALRQAARESDREVDIDAVTNVDKGLEALSAGYVTVLVADHDAALTQPAVFFGKLSKTTMPGRTILISREGSTNVGIATVETSLRPQTLSAIQLLASRIIKGLPAPPRPPI